MNNIEIIYIDLPEEASPTLKKTKGLSLGNGIFKVLEGDSYDPEDEVWEFPPGSIVRCKIVDDGEEKYWRAFERIG